LTKDKFMASEIVPSPKKFKVNILLYVTFFLAVCGLFLPRGRQDQGTVSGAESALGRIQQSKTLRIGYEGYPPYTIKNPTSDELSGYSVDLASHIAKEAGWSVQWIQTSPDTKVPDMQAGKFDVMVEPIFETIPRAARVSFTRPYAYFGYAAGIVRKGDKRFQKIDDLNKSGVTIAVRSGYTDQSYAEQNLALANKRAMNVTDINQVFLDVLSGNSDIALADVEQVKAFAKAHASQVDALFVDNPPALTPAGFMLKQGDFSFYNFLNAAIDYLESNGILDQLDRKYNVSAFREKRTLVPSGRGAASVAP